MLFDDAIYIIDSLVADHYQQFKEIDEELPISQQCRRSYEIYLSIEKIEWSMKHALTHYFSLSLNEKLLFNSHLGKAIDKWRYFSNRDLKKCTNNIIELLNKLHKYSMYLDNNKHPLFSFVNPKSSWVNKFEETYSIRITHDIKLERRCLPFAIPIKNKYWTPYSYYHHPNIDFFDIDAQAKRLQIIDKEKNNLLAIKKIKNKISNNLKRECSIDLLLNT